MSKQPIPGKEQNLEDEIQVGEQKSIAKQEALKHIKKQHPQRDIPKVDEDEEQTGP